MIHAGADYCVPLRDMAKLLVQLSKEIAFLSPARSTGEP
jgi:hypothetical protein